MEDPPNNTDRPVSLLVVDDDAVTREVIGLMLSRRFPEITLYLADEGAKGVELFKKHMPEIVITDIQMPEMDGFEMAAVIKEMKADTKFIVLTAYSSTNNLEKFNTIGGLSFLSKPIEFDKLFAAIETCISRIAEERK
jgi:YesN/AraC family two-component response regulator